ncbi:hypothetical protein HY407_00380 [Candidatus Gottesmanbacteria bacterium]|nr:hypothetical protein [Candidatus Gottesmanbacteria bacterium]
MIKGTPELVQQWLTEGYSKKAVAAFGTSVEFLERALASGEIHWAVPQPDQKPLPYQRPLLKKGGHLYFAYPFINHLRPHEPNLVQQLQDRLNVDLSYHAIKRSLGYHAGYQAISHYYESQTGMKLSSEGIVLLAHTLFPDLVHPYRDNSFLADEYDFIAYPLREWRKPHSLGLEHSTMPLDQLKKIIAQCLSRRGVIIYYNQQILKGTNVRPGFESEDEIIIYSQKPLTLTVISGIKPLAKSDQEAINHLIHTLQ